MTIGQKLEATFCREFLSIYYTISICIVDNREQMVTYHMKLRCANSCCAVQNQTKYWSERPKNMIIQEHGCH